MFEDLKPHLIELRKRLFISCSSIFVMFLYVFRFGDPILSWMTAPLVKNYAEAVILYLLRFKSRFLQL